LGYSRCRLTRAAPRFFLASALRQIVNEPQLGIRLGKIGQQRFKQVFDIKTVAEKMAVFNGEW